MFVDYVGSNFLPEEPYLYDIGDIVDERYIVVDRIGQGGMGAVLLVKPWVDELVYALKYCKHGEDRRRFAREVRAMEKVRHPNVITIIGHNLSHGPPCFLMPVANKSLEDDLPRLLKDEGQALQVFMEACGGVDALHQVGVFHRDLKPKNMLVFGDGSIVVTDLGLAKFRERDTTILTRTVARLGTEAYLAPEQRLPNGSRQADARTDVFQLGKILYQLVTGKAPDVIEYGSMPPGLNHIVRRATCEDPEDRYPNVSALQRALLGYIESKDLRLNPREALESFLAMVQEKEGLPSNSEFSRLLEILRHGIRFDHDYVISCFHCVPVKYLSCAVREHPNDFRPILERYAAAITARAAGYPWVFADEVSDRMQAAYEEAADVRLKSLALQTLMMAADKLGRHSPQRVFVKCLESIWTIELALPIAEMISENASPYVKRFQGFNSSRYHPVIQNAFNAIGDP